MAQTASKPTINYEMTVNTVRLSFSPELNCLRPPWAHLSACLLNESKVWRWESSKNDDQKTSIKPYILTKNLTADRSLGCLDFLKMVPDVSFILRAKSIRRKVSKLTLTWTIWCLCPWILWTELWDDAIPTSVRILHYLTCMRYITKIKINITPTAQ